MSEGHRSHETVQEHTHHTRNAECILKVNNFHFCPKDTEQVDEIVCFPALQLGARVAGGPSVQTAAHHTVWRAWEVDADKVRFGALTQAAANMVRKHSPAAVTPIIFSSRGALRACDNELLPIPEDRNGRHWMRVELITILMKFAFKISVQLWSRRDNSVVPTLQASVLALVRVHVVNTPVLGTIICHNIDSRGWTTIQGYCLSDSGLNDIAVRGNIAAGRSSTTNLYIYRTFIVSEGH